MVVRQIEIDEATDVLLSDLAAEFDGNLGAALAELVQLREGSESIADHTEEAFNAKLPGIKERAERELREGATVSWAEVKQRSGL